MLKDYTTHGRLRIGPARTRSACWPFLAGFVTPFILALALAMAGIAFGE
jgi:hypothetical protein